MTDEHIQNLVERFVEGRLSPDEETALDEIRQDRPELEKLIAAERELRSMLETGTTPAFRPQFDQRVMKRIEEENASPAFAVAQGFSDVDFARALSRLFPRVATPAFALSAFAMAGNASAATPGGSLFEALFGLPTIDIATALFL
ncbi:MAG: hypothetical protein AAF067_07865 [Pseudomonadota bacterium]